MKHGKKRPARNSTLWRNIMNNNHSELKPGTEIVKYCGVSATNKTGSSSDDWIYYQAVRHSLINYTYTMAIQLYLSFTPVKVHRCTCTRVLSPH
jgi:hypothetical protein